MIVRDQQPLQELNKIIFNLKPPSPKKTTTKLVPNFKVTNRRYQYDHLVFHRTSNSRKLELQIGLRKNQTWFRLISAMFSEQQQVLLKKQSDSKKVQDRHQGN